MSETTESSFQNKQPSEHCRRQLVLNRETTNLESHQLIWLSMNNEFVSLESLRNIVDYVQLFENISSCQAYIERTDDIATFLVCSLQFLPSLTPRIHNFRSVYLVYVYTCNEHLGEMTTTTKTISQQPRQEWTSIYKKVKPIYANVHQLLSDLTQDVQFYLQRERKVSAICWSNRPLDDTSLNEPKSLASLIDFWINLPYSADCRQRFVETLKIYYGRDSAKIRVLDEFERSYHSENAVHWYTRETFLYSVLNRALRQQNISLMFLFGFFLRDLYRQLQCEYKQLKSHESETKLTLYRGQLISGSEMKHQRHPLHPLPPNIVNNSLFSTTKDRSLALIYVNHDLDPKDTYSDQGVLFEITVTVQRQDDDLPYRRPFANISHLSHFQSEEEILFMIGTSFRYDRESIQYNADEHVWIFKLELNNDNFEIYENEFNCSSNRRALKRCITLLSKENRSRSASISYPTLKAIFQNLADMYPAETTWLSAMKNQCIAVYFQFVEENYAEALTHYYESLNIWSLYVKDEELNCLSDMGEIHHQIAEILQFEMEDSKQAKAHYDQSIQFFQLSLSEKFALSNYERIQVYKELARVYERRNRFNDDRKTENNLTEIKYWELYFEHIFNCYSPIHTASVWWVLETIADKYSYVGEIDNAISYNETALALHEGLLSLDNYSKFSRSFDSIIPLIHIYRNLVKLNRDHKQNYNLALNYQLILYEYELHHEREFGKNGPETETNLLAEHHSNLADIYRGLDQYHLAYEHLQVALKQYRQVELTASVEWSIAIVEKKIASLALLLS